MARLVWLRPLKGAASIGARTLTGTAPVAAASMPDEQRSDALLKKLEKDDAEGVQSLVRVLYSPLAVERLREQLSAPLQVSPAVSAEGR